MLSLTVSLRVHPELREEFLAAITTQAESCVRDEPGCLSFDVTEDVAEPNHFVLHEAYRDQAAIEHHRTTPHFANWREAAARVVIPGSQVNTVSTVLLSLEDRS
jgi:quinol monooxygenase YgiN